MLRNWESGSQHFKRICHHHVEFNVLRSPQTWEDLEYGDLLLQNDGNHLRSSTFTWYHIPEGNPIFLLVYVIFYNDFQYSSKQLHSKI